MQKELLRLWRYSIIDGIDWVYSHSESKKIELFYTDGMELKFELNISIDEDFKYEDEFDLVLTLFVYKGHKIRYEWNYFKEFEILRNNAHDMVETIEMREVLEKIQTIILEQVNNLSEKGEKQWN